MKRVLYLALASLLAISACSRKDVNPLPDGEGADYIELHYIKWARQPVSCYLGGAGESAPEGFSAPSADQLKKLMSITPKYYGSYNGVKGVLFSKVYIDDFVYASVGDDGTVHSADYNRYTFTDEHLANAVFLPVNDGWDGYYWGNYDHGYYNYLHFSMMEMKVSSVTFVSGSRVFTIMGGMLPVKE